MRTLYTILLLLISLVAFTQTAEVTKLKKDSLLIIEKNAVKGFHHDYLLFIPKGTPLHKKIFLLVEPNNTGKISDSAALHKHYAISLASESSVGNNISTELKIPLLVPVFPRPASRPFLYTHALDRDAMLEKTTALKRLDLQLIAMIDDARLVLSSMHIEVDAKIFMSGFSASASFVNRFSFIHPEIIKALAIGGFNGELMLPHNQINQVKLNYPIGTNDFYRLFDKHFDSSAYRQIHQFIYMGKEDDNDAVQFDDAYSNKERKIINQYIGATVQSRYLKCLEFYKAKNIQAEFRNYDHVGHFTTGEMNLEVIRFFLHEMK